VICVDQQERDDFIQGRGDAAIAPMIEVQDEADFVPSLRGAHGGQ
jgi:hypothetical protein